MIQIITINQQYLDRFSKNHCEYLYYIKPGTFLAFDKDTLEYIGVEYFNFIPYKNDANIIDKTLNDLLAKSILEIL